jgi:hemerythrin-like domain-containing protein
MARPESRIIRDQHASIAAMLRSLSMMIDRGPGDEPERFFDVLRAMLFYIDEFPERQHHPTETKYLFPRLLQVAPELSPVVDSLDSDHLQGEYKVRALQHLLLAWELLGDSRRRAFETGAREYVAFYLDHMRREEADLLPAAERLFTDADWAEVGAAFHAHVDPLGPDARDPAFDRLFTRIVLTAPAPIGVGPALAKRATA